MAEHEYDYQGYIWKDLADRILKDSDENHLDAPEPAVDELADRLKVEFDEQISEQSFDAAEKWLQGFDAILPEIGGVAIPEDNKSNLVFSILGANLLTALSESLEVNIERITLEQRRTATNYLREYSKLLLWLGANTDELKKEVPSVK